MSVNKLDVILKVGVVANSSNERRGNCNNNKLVDDIQDTPAISLLSPPWFCRGFLEG